MIQLDLLQCESRPPLVGFTLYVLTVNGEPLAWSRHHDVITDDVRRYRMMVDRFGDAEDKSAHAVLCVREWGGAMYHTISETPV